MKKIFLIAIFALFVHYSYAQRPFLISTADFKKLVYNYDVNRTWKFEGKIPAVVYFYADWCAPCKKMAPVIEELAKQYKDKVIFYKVNVDNDSGLAQYFNISSIPFTLFARRNGEPYKQIGGISKEDMRKYITDFLKVTL